MTRPSTILLLTVIAAGGLAAAPAAPAGLERLRSLRGDPEACRAALDSADPVLRRAAFRGLLEDGGEARAAIERGLKDRDPLIRQRSLFEGYRRYGNAFLPRVRSLVREEDPRVAATLLAIARAVQPRDLSTGLLKELAEQAALPEIRRQASRLADFAFHRENHRLRDNPAFDHDIVVAKAWKLPQAGWAFRPDPLADGHHKDYFAPGFDDSAWRRLGIGPWEDQGYPGYDGVAWYRLRFRMPARIESNAVELSFGAVDESAWVWLNGRYIGQHDEGPRGWDRPFALDVTREVRWDSENVLVVRVEDTRDAGGIWKPVGIDVLR